METEIDIGATLTISLAMLIAIVSSVYRLKRSDEKVARHIRRKRLLSTNGGSSGDLKKDATTEDSDTESDDEHDDTDIIRPWGYESEEGRNWLYERLHSSSSRQEQYQLEKELQEIQLKLQKGNL